MPVVTDTSTNPIPHHVDLGPEKGFSAAKYFALALVISAIGVAVLPFCFPLSIALFVVGGWCLWSASIIVLNRAAKGTCFETVAAHLHAIAMEVNSAVISAGLFIPTLFERYHAPRGNKEGRPILMVNGYLSFGATWNYQRQRLEEEGFGPIYTMNVGSCRSIKDYAEAVQKKVEQIQKETGKKELTLIGHSRGGLISAYYATHLAKEDEKIDVITIGSPLAGTRAACIGFGDDAREMRLESEFHALLRKKMEKHVIGRFFHIASESDYIASPTTAIFGDNKVRQMIFKDLGHLGLLFSSRVSSQISHWLRNPSA